MTFKLLQVNILAEAPLINTIHQAIGFATCGRHFNFASRKI